MPQFPDVLSVSVTQNDIDKAWDVLASSPSSWASNCPVALATGGLLGDELRIVATVNEVAIWSMEELVAVYNLPAAANKFIRDFDRGGIVEPISFEAVLAK